MIIKPHTWRSAWQWTWAQTRHRWGVFCATTSLLALSMVVVVCVLASPVLLNHTALADVGKIGLIVAGKGSALQWTMASVYHVDAAPSTLALSAAQTLLKPANIQFHIARQVQIAMGDSVGGARIIGVDSVAQYLAFFDAKVSIGTLPTAPMQAVAGAQAAQRLSQRPQRFNLRLGSTFLSEHGLEAGGAAHDGAPYTLVGVLAPTGTVLDTLVITPIESVWLSHEGVPRDAQEAALLAQARDISAVLIEYKHPLSAVALPRLLEKSAPPEITIAPIAAQLQRLWVLFEPFFKVLAGLAGLVSISACAGLFLAAHLTQAQRLRDLAVLRMMGVRPLVLCGLIGLEALLQWVGACMLMALALATLMLGASGYTAHSLAVMLELTAPSAVWVCAAAALCIVLANAITVFRLIKLSPVALLLV